MLRRQFLVLSAASIGAAPVYSLDGGRGVVNLRQQHRNISNLSVTRASTFPHSGAADPTPTILALTYRTADTIVDTYLKKPGMLA